MNDHEEIVKTNLEKRGFEVLRKGWPDFLVLTKDWKKGFALELKRGKDKLSNEQERMQLALARFGILTMVSRAEEDGVNLAKKGRTLLLPADLSDARNELRALQNEHEGALKRIYQLQQTIEAASVLFEPPSEGERKNECVGLVWDASDGEVEKARERLRMMEMDEYLRQAAGITE